MACSTRARVASLTLGLPLRTRDTVPRPTPACAATSAIVGMALPPKHGHPEAWNRFHGLGSKVSPGGRSVNDDLA